MRICKICKIPLKDNSQYLDIYGSNIRKEECNCPYEDKHEEIVQKRLEKYPTRCPICDSAYNVDTDSRIYKNAKRKITVSIDSVCSCGFSWTIIGEGEPLYDEEQLNEYGEWK